MRLIPRLLCVAAILALPLPSFAQLNPVWTAVASTGVVDEANLTPVNFAFGGGPPGLPSLGFLGASIQPAIVARYNVTNLDGAMNPTWSNLELGAIDTSGAAGNQVVARLIRVHACDGTQVVLCSTTSTTSSTGVCTRCIFAAGAFDFTQFLYYVEVTVSRTASTVNEQALTLRIF
jgi:hypothetical protein